MSAETITIVGISQVIKRLNDARLELIEIKLRAELGETSPETAAQLVKEIRDHVIASFDQ